MALTHCFWWRIIWCRRNVEWSFCHALFTRFSFSFIIIRRWKCWQTGSCCFTRLTQTCQKTKWWKLVCHSYAEVFSIADTLLLSEKLNDNVAAKYNNAFEMQDWTQRCGWFWVGWQSSSLREFLVTGTPGQNYMIELVALVYWNFFLTDELIESIVDSTNKYVGLIK